MRDDPLLALEDELVAAARRRHPIPLSDPGILVWTGGGASCCGSAADIRSAGDLSSRSGGTGSPTRFYDVVPDGVARIAFTFPGAGGAPALTRRTAVHANVAAVPTSHGCCAALRPGMIWYAADGRVIRRIAAIPTPAPAPASTPNPVTVAPAVGPPDAHFTAHFRALASDQQYYDKLAGPAGCAASLSFPAVSTAGDIRGRLLSIPLGALPGRCAGRWTVSVGIRPARRSGPVRSAPAPFGSATFTVGH